MKKTTVTNTDEQRRRPSQGDETKNENEGTTEKRKKKAIQMHRSHKTANNTRNHLIEIISPETWNVSEEKEKKENVLTQLDMLGKNERIR